MLFDMGCVVSKMDDSELVSLCRERKELIKATVDCRCALASAHILYFQSLLDVSNALNGFIEEELVVSVDLPSSVDSDRQLSGEDSHLEFSSMESDTDLGSLTDCVHEVSEVSEPSSLENDSQLGESSNVYYMKKFSTDVPTSVFEQPQVVYPTVQWHDSSKLFTQYPQNGNRVSSNGPMNFRSNSVRFPQYENETFSGGPMNFLPNNLRFSQYGNGLSSGCPMNFPPNNPRFAQYENGVPFGDQMLPPNNLMFPQYGNVKFSGGPMNFPFNNLVSDPYGNKVSYGISMDGPPHDPYYNQPDSSAAPQSPPPPEVSTWDYLNPFNLVDDIFPSNFFRGRYGSGFSSSDSDLREMREREGIPDLEYDTKRSLMEEAPNEIELEVNDREDLDEGPSEEVPLRNGEEVLLSQENESKSSDDGPVPWENETKSSDDGPVPQEIEMKRHPDTIGKESTTKSDTVGSNGLEEEERKKGTFQVKEALTKEGESSRQVNSTPLASNGSRDFRETLKEIRDAFDTAFNYGKEVSIMLEAGKLPYQPGVFSSWIWSLMGPSMVTYSVPAQMMSKRSASRVVRIAKAKNGNLENDICMNSRNLSSTLEKIYLWEKKLYEEVKRDPNTTWESME
ncbi:hypothetical protein F0562_005836 [Nyssa sinensis]|uniref:DUF630 domain-containing protein n=1 Tax=Nyssa sinensis TaxID=561372 RepID=A0A5J5ANY8_9ASTE|nr:hypothetical protein F0562_005836 [Nyssa sinensis]